MSNPQEPELIQPINPAEPSSESSAKSSAKLSAEPRAKKLAGRWAGVYVEETAQPAAEPAAERAIEPAADPAADPADRTIKLELFRVIIAVVFLVLFAYDTWQGIDSAIVMGQYGFLNTAQWVLLIVAIILPIALWLIGCALLWRRSRSQLMLGLLVAWMTSAALFIDMKFLLGILGNL